MKITGFDVIDCDLGWRTISFLRLSAGNGMTGWSEFNESFGNHGLGAVVRTLADSVIGRDPLAVSPLVERLSSFRAPAPGGINRQAIGAVENALMDLKGRILGVSVAELLGGAVRDRVPLYWSHCGNYRLAGGVADLVGRPPIHSYDDVEALGREVRERGYRGLKTNVIAFDDPEVQGREAGWSRLPHVPGRYWDDRMIAASVLTIEAFRRGAGPDAAIHLDANFGYEADGYRRLARALEHTGLAWLELDGLDPATLAALRASARVPIASGESVFEARGYLPYLEARSLDVAIVDVVWNGIAESARIANLAAAFSVSVAPHNFYGPLATIMSAHFSAAAPNFSVMEIDVDAVPWRDDFLVTPPLIEDGDLVLPTGPGWGVEVDEDALRAHPSRTP